MKRTSWIAIGSLVVGSVVAWALADRLSLLDLKTAADVGKVTGQLMMLIFIALLIERAVEVFIGPLTGQDKDILVTRQGQLRKRMEEANAVLSAKRDELIKDPESKPIKDAIATLEAAIKSDQADEAVVLKEISVVDRRTQGIALAISIPLSFAIALAGVRAVGGLLPSAEVLKSGDDAVQQQLRLFTAVDVVLTAGLLAGGADGVHKILDRFLKIAAGKDVQQPAAK